MAITITLTDEARRYLTPRSVEALPPKKAVDRAALFSKFSEGARLLRSVPRWEDDAALAEEGPAARALLASDGEPSEELSLRTWAVALQLSFERAAGVAYLAQRLGVVRAFEALLDASGIDYEGDVRQGVTRLFARPAAHPTLETGIDVLLLRATASERAQAEAISEARFEGAPFVERMVLLESRFDRPSWADALVEPFLKRPRRDSEGWRVLVARLGSLEHARALLSDSVCSSVVDLIRFGDEALPLLIEALSKAEDAHRIKHLARAVALFSDPRAADALASIATRAPAQPFALDFFQRHPHEAARALGPLAEGKSKQAVKVRELLVRIPEVEAEAAEKPAPKRAAATKKSASTSAQPKTPSKDALGVLTDPPWEKGKKRGPIVVPQVTIPFEEAIVPDAHDAARRAELAPLRAQRLDAAQKKKLYAWVEDPALDEAIPSWVQLPEDEAIALYARWPEKRPYVLEMERDVMALFGIRAIEGLLRHAEQALHQDFAPAWILRVRSPRLAMVLLRAASSVDQAGVIGDWLALHRDAALAGIVPIAVGPLGEDRTLAERGLIELSRLHGREAVLGTSDAARAACEEILDAAVSVFGPARPPKVEAELAGLPPVRLRGRATTLSSEEVAVLVGYLSASGLALQHPALTSVREACEPRDLAELAWTLARSWEIGRAKKNKTWMIDALVPFADDDVVRRVLPALKRARALTVLSSIATDAAAVELLSATESGQLAHQAARDLARIAARRGLSVDELEESLAPSFVEGAALHLTLAGKDYVVRLDAQLALRIEDAAGKVSKRLPARPPSSASQGESADDARMRARYDELAADVARLVPRRIRVMERRMILGTLMSHAALMAWHLRHPLWAPIARGVVWSWEHRGARGTFRVTEEGTFTDEHDEPVTLKDDARFGIPHPRRMTDATRARWATLLSDYAVVQPFAQIDRPLTLPTAAELEKSVLTRPASFGVDQHGTAVLDRGLAGRGPSGWLYRVVIEGHHLVLRGPDAAPFFVEASLKGGARFDTPVPLSVLDPIVLAEHFHALGA